MCRSCGNEIAFSKDLIAKLSPNSLDSFTDSIFDRDEVLIQIFVGNFILDHPVVSSSTANCAGILEVKSTVPILYLLTSNRRSKWILKLYSGKKEALGTQATVGNNVYAQTVVNILAGFSSL